MNHEPSIVERGDIFFLYRPAVGEEEPKGLVDVQRFFVALRPEAGAKLRLLVIGRKRLPDVGRHERGWGFVERVERTAEELERGLRANDYETQTRGLQHEPAVRPAGEGVYAVALVNGQLHLCYALELPAQPSDVQRAFKIAPEASFALSIKNPEASTPAGAGLSQAQKPEYPQELQKEFGERRFEREDVRMLDFPGAEFILVGARLNPESAYGLELPTEDGDYAHAQIIRELRMANSRHPMKPLFEGQWQ
jgi:hypothetical protein